MVGGGGGGGGGRVVNTSTSFCQEYIFNKLVTAWEHKEFILCGSKSCKSYHNFIIILCVLNDYLPGLKHYALINSLVITCHRS